MIIVHITKCFPCVSSPGYKNCRNAPQAPALQIWAILTLSFQNLKFCSELFGVRKKTHLLLTVVSGAPGDVMQGREERGRCHPSALVAQHRLTWMKESRLDLDFGPILTFVLDMGIFQTPGSSFLSLSLGKQPEHTRPPCPARRGCAANTRYPLTSGEISRLQKMDPAGNFTLEKHRPRC